MIFLWIALGALALWVTFIYAPSFVMYRMIFSRRPITSPDEESLSETPLAPHTAEIMRDMAYLETLSPETVTVTAGDGTPLGGRYFRRGGGKSVIFFHGYNTHPMKNFAVHARLFIEHGYDALVVFERGHGESGGAHNGMGLLERGDVPAWIEKARELSPGCRIVLYGMSMGAFAVAMASGSLDPADACCAVIDCGFSSPYKQLAHDAAMRSCRRYCSCRLSRFTQGRLCTSIFVRRLETRCQGRRYRRCFCTATRIRPCRSLTG